MRHLPTKEFFQILAFPLQDTKVKFETFADFDVSHQKKSFYKFSSPHRLPLLLLFFLFQISILFSNSLLFFGLLALQINMYFFHQGEMTLHPHPLLLGK